MVIGFIGWYMIFWWWYKGYKNISTRQSYTLAQWIIIQSRGFTRKDLERVNKCVRVYVYLVYLVLPYQVQARSSIVGNSASAVDA